MSNQNFPGCSELENLIIHKDKNPIFFDDVLDKIINLMEMSLQIFTISTLRIYEYALTEQQDKYSKKSKQIFSLLDKRYKTPTLGSMLELARSCFYLISDRDEFVPKQLKSMKLALEETVVLEDLHFILRDLTDISNYIEENSGSKVQRKYGPSDKSSILTSLLPEIVEFRNKIKHRRQISLVLENDDCDIKLNYLEWEKAYRKFLDIFSPILHQKYISKTLHHARSADSTKIEDSKEKLQLVFKVKIYDQGKSFEQEEVISIDDYRADDLSFIEMNENNTPIFIEIYPFVIIQNDLLKHYKRTSAKGYEYYSICQDKISVVPTKRKFNHSVFRTGKDLGDQQRVFWTEVKPSIHQYNKIKANIPQEGLDSFVGRKKQIRNIVEEIIEIPNIDGIVFGPGGVGKTALMRQISNLLFNERDLEKVLFSNIIWVTAKKDYYNPVISITEENVQRFESLDNIFSVILKFFEYQNVDEYSLEDKKEIVLETFEENKVLLILDNFETVTPVEAKKIVDFFSIEAKKYLKGRWQNFKVILTSRETIPSGFHQIKLKGLDLKESKLLMKNEFNRYKDSNKDLTEDEKNEIYDKTHGIPILIKHVYGRLYEFNEPFSLVVRKLFDLNTEVIQFSFAEIIEHIKKNEISLKLLILMDLYGKPLMIRQLSDILEIEEIQIEKKIQSLLNYQCIDILHEGASQKYFINSDIDLLIKGLVSDHPGETQIIKEIIISNFPSNKQMDYTKDEEMIISIFNRMILDKEFAQAEEFIQEKRLKNPNSILISYTYGMYLLDIKNDILSAKSHFQELVSNCIKNNTLVSVILMPLIKCYLSQAIPDYAESYKYVVELEKTSGDEREIKIFFADFYISWSSAVKNSGMYTQLVREAERKDLYKNLAQKGLRILTELDFMNEHNLYYLKALGLFNIYENEEALKAINKAIDLNAEDPNYHSAYISLRFRITRKFSRKNKIGF